jgi:hypothetical protein
MHIYACKYIDVCLYACIPTWKCVYITQVYISHHKHDCWFEVCFFLLDLMGTNPRHLIPNLLWISSRSIFVCPRFPFCLKGRRYELKGECVGGWRMDGGKSTKWDVIFENQIFTFSWWHVYIARTHRHTQTNTQTHTFPYHTLKSHQCGYLQAAIELRILT